jgi:hypothetical protein
LFIKSFKVRRAITQFRISAHRLKIETCRYQASNNYISPLDRICEKCNLKKAETELHFLIECPFYRQERIALFDKINDINSTFSTYTNLQKFLWLCSCEDIESMKNVGKFIVESFHKRLSS